VERTFWTLWTEHPETITWAFREESKRQRKRRPGFLLGNKLTVRHGKTVESRKERLPMLPRIPLYTGQKKKKKKNLCMERVREKIPLSLGQKDESAQASDKEKERKSTPNEGRGSSGYHQPKPVKKRN